MASAAAEQEAKDLIGSLVSSPPDLTFAFLDEHGDILGELRAHKQLLSVRSSYFKQLFWDEVGVGVINLKPEHRRPVKALIAQVYDSADLPEILDQLDLPDLLALGSFGEEYQLAGVREVAEERLASFSLPPMEQAAVAAASEARKYPLLGEKLLKALHQNCAKTLLLTVRTDKQVKEFLKRHQGTEHESFSLKMKELMDQLAKDPNRDDESLEKKEGVVIITKEYLKKMQREKAEEEKREKQKVEKELKLMSCRRKREKRKEKEVVMTTGGVKGDEYNMEEVLAALGEIKKKSRQKVKKRPAQSTVTANAREIEIPVTEPETVAELTSPCCNSSASQSVEGETSESKAMDRASQGLERSQPILFDESLFDENLFDEHLESVQSVIKEMYEPAASPVESRQTTSNGLNWDAKEFIPRQSPTPPSWLFHLPADPPSLNHDLRLSSPTPHNLQTQLLLPPYGSNNLALQHQKCSPGLADPDHLVSQNHPGNGLSSPLQCCSIGVNMRHSGSIGQHTQDSRMSHSPDILGCPGQPVLGSVHPSIDGGQEHGLKTNFLGIVPVSSFFTPVQSGHHHEVLNKLKHKHEKLCYCVILLLKATWVQHPSTIIQARMPVLLQSAGSGLLPDVFPAQPAHPLPLDLPKGDQLINMSSVDSIAQHQASGHVSSPPFHLQAQGQEDIYSSPVPSSLPVPHESSPTSPDVSFLQPSFLSPTYDRARHIAPGF